MDLFYYGLNIIENGEIVPSKHNRHDTNKRIFLSLFKEKLELQGRVQELRYLLSSNFYILHSWIMQVDFT